MVFGQPVYNTQQRKAILAEFKRYIDELRKKENLPLWKVVKTKTKTKKVKRKKIKRNNLAIKLYKKRKRKTKRRDRR